MLCWEINAATVALEVTANTPKGRETDVRLTTLRTALGAIEKAMTMYEDLLEDCQMQEEEAHQEEAPPEDPDEEYSDTEMADDEDDRREEADAEVLPPPLEDTGPTPPVPGGDVVSPEEDALLMQPSSQPEGPVAGSHSPRSEAGMVLGEMAGLSWSELTEGETAP